MFSVLVDSGSRGEWQTVLEDKRVQNGNTLTVDVRKYLENGSNRVRFIAKGETSEETGSLIFSANVTTMYLAPANFNWAKPFTEGSQYALGGVTIGGVIPKVLRIKVTGEGYEKTYENNIGTQTYITNAYYFNGLEFPATGTGVYHVEMWLDATSVESDHLHYDIMCVASADLSDAQLVVINEAKEEVQNYSDGVLFKYACYNGGTSTASPSINVSVGDVVIADEVLSDVTTNSIYSYSASVEIDSDAAELSLEATMELGNVAEVVIPIDNSLSYPAKKGAAFYMNTTNRSNSQANRESIINEINGEEIAAEWRNIAFVDGIDGYTTDDTGRKCLRIPATCGATINYQPFASVSGKTIEIAFKVANVADYDEDVITIATDDSESFAGVKIKPTNVAAYSNLKRESEKQSYNLKDEELVHLVISLTKDYRQTFGNLAKIYVNGEVRCEFAYTGSDSWSQAASIVLGSSSADLFVYKMRVYDSGCDWFDAVQNYVNCLPTLEEKNSVYKKVMAAVDDSFKVDYGAVTKAGFNTMVVEMLGGAVLPDKLHSAGGNCNLTINIHNIVEGELDEDFIRFFSGETLTNVPIEGQGTTAMTYYRWNLRNKLQAAYNKRRITAKKNVASSMHSHKMGATRAYNDLHNVIVGMNEAGARVAIAQYPVYGFLKEKNELGGYSYTFIGLYTIGADKGDKATFGYDDDAFKDSILSLEGTDHTPLAVGFDYPWSATKYSYSREAMGAASASGDVAAAWEVSMSGDFDTDKSADEANVQNLLNDEFKPAYDLVYNCATFIEGVSESLETINTNAIAWQKAHTAKEFYTDGVYDLYYFDVRTNTYQANDINLLTQFGLSADDVASLTLEEKTALFIQKRKEYFKAHISEYWDLRDALFCYAFILIFGATDNFKKNSYPYKFSRLADGGRWCWRQDDLDTLFDINNQGFAAKIYSILVGDTTASGSIFRGDDSMFWTLLGECFMLPDATDTSIPSVKSMVHSILDTMAELSPYGQSTLERVVGYIRSTFWDFAQAYFPQSAYNADAEWTYEEAWGIYGTSYQNDVHPLQQSLGGHYEAERRWVELRVIFIASYFNFGAFATDNGDDQSLGQVSFRAVGGKTYTLTPAIDMNPTILVGQSDLSSAGGRIKAGAPVDVVVADMGSNDTHVYIQGADYLESLGDLKDLTVSSDISNLTLKSKRLRSLKVGDEVAENVTSNVTSLELGALPSLESIDARNLATLGGEVTLEGCPRIKEALLSGTNINNLAIPHGSKIEKVELPSSIKNLALVRLNNLALENLTYDNLANVTYLRVDECANLNGFAMLKEAFSAEGSQLKNIRVVGFDYEGDATDLYMLATLANGRYTGIDADGRETTGLPVIEGTLHITAPVDEETYNAVTGAFKSLILDAPNVVDYIKFADPVVAQICADNWGDTVGITKAQAAAVTSIGTVFSGNTEITSFDEFEKFTGVTFIAKSAFSGCYNLKEIALPKEVTTIYDSAFEVLDYDVNTARKVISLENISYIGSRAFHNSGFSGEINAPNLEMLGTYSFTRTNFSAIKSLGSVSSIPNGGWNKWGCFSHNNSMRILIMPESISQIGSYAFSSCNALETVVLSQNVTIIGEQGFSFCAALQALILKSTTPPSLGGWGIEGTLIDSGTGSIYVPDGTTTDAEDNTITIVEAYKAATNWSTYAAQIFPISQLAIDNPELYAEIEEYL